MESAHLSVFAEALFYRCHPVRVEMKIVLGLGLRWSGRKAGSWPQYGRWETQIDMLSKSWIGFLFDFLLEFVVLKS